MSSIIAIIDEGEAQIKQHENQFWYFIDGKPIKPLSDKALARFNLALATESKLEFITPQLCSKLTNSHDRVWYDIRKSPEWSRVVSLFDSIAPKLEKIRAKHIQASKSRAGKASALARWSK